MYRNKPVFPVKIALDFEIYNMLLRTAQKIHTTEDSRKPKLILTFEIGARTPFQNDCVYNVLPLFHII